MIADLVEARHEQSAWRVAVPELGIHTHTRTLHRTADVASGLIGQLLDVPADSFEVHVSRHPNVALSRGRS